MSNRPMRGVRYRWLWTWCAVLLAGVMWRAAAPQFTGGFFDLVVFVPSGAALGIAAVWSAHGFMPERFTWHRGLVGGVVGGLVISPLIAFLVAFAAAWDRPSFPLVFIVGALLAMGGGLAGGGVLWVVNWVRQRRFHGKIEEARHAFQAIRNHRGARRGRMRTGHQANAGERFSAGGRGARRRMAGGL